MIIDHLHKEHCNIEKLLRVLEQELDVFDRGDQPDYEAIHAVISYFEVYIGSFHHPQEDLLFERLKKLDPTAASSVGDLTAEHSSGNDRLRRVSHAVESVLMDHVIPRSMVVDIIRELRQFDVEVSVHDPVADAAEALHEYDIRLRAWEDLPAADALILAVAHRQFVELPASAYLQRIVRHGCFIDVKSAFDPGTFRKEGLRVWRL